ncbi:restriction endonuclease subunit S [Pseudomonas sp. Ga0074129]|uniref:restriction endonuclease subunit S n=1 Tax=Pseudomonas sp. Ga0074129 TaxID=1752219 RepID=UPI000AF046CE|nr:restriction endonuclease subunit S [Pseudomonas sp. Ga0074129]
MSFPTHPTYKDSGVEWLGEVPEHWVMGSLKNMAQIRNGRDYKEVESSDGEYPVIGSGGQFSNATQYLYEGESVLLGRKGTIDKPLYINGRFWTVDTMFYTEISKGACAKFFYYNSLTIPFDYYSTSTALPSMTQADLLNHPAAIPTKLEQTQIARFLDHETARIDALIEEQQRLIELLKEKRQAVISHAVTKGLDSTVPMKDSGVEWLGEVPAHWQVGALKHFISPVPGAIKTGPFGSHLKSEDMKEGPYKVFNQRSVIDADFSAGDNFISEEKFAELRGFTAFPGDVLVTTRGTIGRAAILPDNAEVGILHPCLLRVQVDESKITSSYLCRLIQESHLLKTQLSLMSNSTTIEVIYSETMANLLIPVPPITEQAQIAAFLDDVISKFGALTSDANESVRLLQERRSALISAAVTGKIDVRGWQPPASTQAPELAVAEAV